MIGLTKLLGVISPATGDEGFPIVSIIVAGLALVGIIVLFVISKKK